MRARVIAASLIVAVATGTGLAQSMSAPPTRVGEIGLYAGRPDSQISASWPVGSPICQTPLTQAQPLAVTPVGLGPFIDMDNRRWDEDDAKRRQREQELKEQARREQEFRERSRSYGYAYPPYPYDYPAHGYYYSPSAGYQYRSNGYYSYLNSGQYSQPYYYRPPGYYYPNHGYYYPDNGYASRPNDERRARDERAGQKRR